MKWKREKCKCPQCGHAFKEPIPETMRPRYAKNGEQLPHNVECDRCMEARVGKVAFAEYQRIAYLIGAKCDQ